MSALSADTLTLDVVLATARLNALLVQFSAELSFATHLVLVDFLTSAATEANRPDVLSYVLARGDIRRSMALSDTQIAEKLTEKITETDTDFFALQ